MCRKACFGCFVRQTRKDGGEVWELGKHSLKGFVKTFHSFMRNNGKFCPKLSIVF